MIFNEIYSAYYNAVAKILSELLNGAVDEEKVIEIVSEYAFGESVLSILPAIHNEKWQLIGKDFSSVIKHKPTLPLTMLQKQWLKAVFMDPRIRLFSEEPESLKDTEPLFTENDYYIFDKYADGDSFNDEEYIERFRLILSSIKLKLPINIEYFSREGFAVETMLLPQRLEYSEKDDKFRLIGTGSRNGNVINLASIKSCSISIRTEFSPTDEKFPENCCVTLKIFDKRNALERCMLHFAHFEKRAEHLSDNEYLLHVTYNKTDESEIIIRVLSFGPMVEVISPDSFREQLKLNLKKQKSCGLN